MKDKASLRPGDNTIRIFFCLMTAAAMWLFLALNEEYEYHMDVALEMEQPAEYQRPADMVSSVNMKVKASGWNLLWLQTSHPVLQFSTTNLETKTFLDLNTEMKVIQATLPEKVVVLDVYPTFISLNWIKITEPKIPVELQNLDSLQSKLP